MPKRMSRIEICEEEQLLLSKERTILSFMRTGLAFVGTGIIIAGFFREFISAQIAGYCLTFIGFIEVFESIRRLLVKQKEADKLKRKIGKDFTI
jgi:uncharacterized membrane protein YidH (DUF202 family)